MDVLSILRGVLGLVVLLGICYALSLNRSKIDWRLVASGAVMQLVIALALLKIPFVSGLFSGVANFFVLMINSAGQAAKFLFGDLANGSPFGFAFLVLPTIIFFSALSSLLYYYGILQRIVYVFAWIMSKTMRLSGAESLAAAANVFIGQTEAPLVVKPYLENMTRSEIMCLMTGGFATIAGGVFGAYVAMLGGDDLESQRFFGLHLLTASIISAPAAIVAAKIIMPETEPDKVSSKIQITRDQAGANALDAISRGTTDGLRLAVNVGAMLLAFMAFIYLFNHFLDWIGTVTNLNETIKNATSGTYTSLSIQYLLGMICAPIAWLIGVPAQDMVAVGQLIGEKMALNEFVAYTSLANMKDTLAPASVIIATYALCGFSNFASIGIQIGGVGSIAPGQRKNLIELGLRAMIAGTIACLMTAAIARMII
ncbi:MAG: nucleoside transporter C-terminal domain-containing protein [Saprospiraceae bacterium]|nr:nucleoside transporter C-terminal domain-containing protein [Saprospiraceae bacterium]